MRIDERSGQVARLRLGDEIRTVSAVLGRGENVTGDEGGGLPLGADSDRIGAPITYAFPAPCDRSLPGAPQDGTPNEVGVTEIRYRGSGASFCRGRAFLFVVSSRGSSTTAGAAIGQSLERARKRYPTLRCRTSPGSTEPPVPVYKYCTGKIGPRRYLWLGQDPVSSIAIATVGMAG
jgi:hypothetical protein